MYHSIVSSKPLSNGVNGKSEPSDAAVILGIPPGFVKSNLTLLSGIPNFLAMINTNSLIVYSLAFTARNGISLPHVSNACKIKFAKSSL